MKKGAKVLITTLVAVTFLIAIVSAQSSLETGFVSGAESIINGIAELLNAILKPIFGDSAVGGLTSGEVLFIKALFFVVILTMVWLALEQFPLFGESLWAVALSSIAVSILATRFIATPGWIETILLPYSVLGIVFTAAIPLIIFFFGVEKGFSEYKTLRKILWIFAAVVFTALFFSRVGDIAQNVSSDKFNPAWIYLITAGACIIFLLFDKTIQNAIRKAQYENLASLAESKTRVQITKEINELWDGIREGRFPVNTKGKVTGTTYRPLYKNLKGRAKAAKLKALFDALPKPA